MGATARRFGKFAPIAGAVVALLFALALAGCSPDYSGTYEYQASSDSGFLGQTVSETITLNKDGSASIKGGVLGISGTEQGTWKATSGSNLTISVDGTDYQGTMDNGTLTLNGNTFKKAA